MPIKPFNFPGVSLTQEFVASNVGTQAVLSVACIGRPYYLHRADVESEAAVTDNVVITAGSTSSAYPLPGLVTEIPLTGGSASVAPVDTANVKLFVIDGQFQHVQITGVSKAVAASATSVEIDCKKNVKSGLGYTADAAFGTREVQVGDKVAITGTSVSGTAEVTEISKSTTSGGYGLITLDLSGATIGGSGGTISSFWFLVEDDAELVVSSGATGVTVVGGSTNTFQVKASVGAKQLDGTDTFCLLTGGTYSMAVQYRQENGLFKGQLGEVYNSDDVESVLGGACVDNPLALAVKFAALAAPGTLIYFTTPKSSAPAGDVETDVTSWKEANDFLEKYVDIYSIVPATSNLSIITTILNDVLALEGDEDSKARRSVWYGLDPQLLADVKDIWNLPETTNTSRVTLLKTVRANVPSSYKAQAIWADGATYGGEDIPNWALAAAAAGMRSYQPCHRPLSNLGYTFFTLKEGNGFTRSQLKQIAAEGIWIVGNNTDGLPINMRQLTTAVANDINKDEESIIANVDEISLGLCRLGEDKVGCSNITPVMLMALKDSIKWFMDKRLTNQSGSVFIGPQLVSWTLVNIWQDAVQRDHVYATIECEPPKPFNRFKMTLRII